ncbi:uncharacterized protein EI97DRAFT_455041 [Westerdykella ornata]|uniref:C2H2-type domain-containing protein n=1 Tax=Westerdykella ornata TaxID=318751 RepID=A0A6A6JWK0_WESOR|nr:uncharacterized protein EI97DRAFT_455041 [Westerdykella ornata]KAF2280116.1 hypothetical protein EI97DRAFT_455041 [Westerdykella ornata]
MPPRRNVAPPNAVRQFVCDICDKGYPRQPDFENHLRSYDHNHRQRLLDMKKITARSEQERGERKRGPDHSKAIDGPSKRVAGAPRFTRVGDTALTGATSARFTKVGPPPSTTKIEPERTPAEGASQQADATAHNSKEGDGDRIAMLLEKQDRVQKGPQGLKELNANKEKQSADEPFPPRGLIQDQQEHETDDRFEETENAVEERDDKAKSTDMIEEVITWEQYDFTKPTGCDHATCPGCRIDGIGDGGDVFPTGMGDDTGAPPFGMQALKSVETA